MSEHETNPARPQPAGDSTLGWPRDYVRTAPAPAPVDGHGYGPDPYRAPAPAPGAAASGPYGAYGPGGYGQPAPAPEYGHASPTREFGPSSPLPEYGPPGSGGPPQHPAYPGQPAWSPTPPAGRGGGRTVALVSLVLVLMLVAATVGGVVGAWTNQQFAGGGSGGTVVIDGPQLDRASLASVASQVQPSVVSIAAGAGEGSGVVMSDDGYVLTNAHVVETAQGDQVRVRFSNGQVSDATVVGADARSDLAVVQVRDVSDLTPVAFGDSDQLLVGDTVLAIGSPLGFQGTVTQGIVSALDRTLRPGGADPSAERPTLTGLLQTDASINPGNSGGPLVNLSGEVVGINTAIATAGPESGSLGVGFAIPSNQAESVAQQLIAGEEVSHPYLGVTVAPAETGGAVVGEVVPGSPADQAGLQEGDIVTRIGDRSITDSNDLVSAVRSAGVGETVEVEFQRGGSTQTTQVTLAELPD